MLFNSYIFILLFLPLALIGYFLVNRKNISAAQCFLIAMSLWFYGYNNPIYLIIIISSVIINYIISKLFQRISGSGARTALFVLGLSFDVGILVYYMYSGFLLWNFNHFLGSDFIIRYIALPLGISFYSIQQISYLIDTYKDTSIHYSFTEYALYVTFFPQLVAGPIVYHNELID